MQKITPFLWFEKEAGEAAKFYASVFKGSKIKSTNLLRDTPTGTVEVVTIELMGLEFTLMSAGPRFNFNESISFQIHCKDQDEVDYFWKKLTDGGQESMCGWLKDKYGVSWQVVPDGMAELMHSNDAEKSKRAMQAMLQMKKIDLKILKQAYDNK